MELKQYWLLFRKWLWLIVLTTVVAAAAAYIFSSRQTPVYQASTRLRVIEGTSNNPSVSYQDILLSERLSRTYAQLLNSRPILEATIERVGLVDVDVRKLAAAISVTPVRDTQLIDLQVEHIVPELAAEIANALPQVFTEITSAQQSARYQESRQGLQEQLVVLGDQVAEAEGDIEALQGVTGNEAESTRLLLENRLAQYRSSYGNVLAQLESIRLTEANAGDSVIVVESAISPRAPIRPRVLMNTLLAAIVGGMLGLGAAFLIEYLDDTVKLPDDVTRVTGLSTLGVIAKQKSENDKYQIVTRENPRAPISEAYRSIRTGIQFSSVDKPIQTLMVTSASPNEGKSTTAANLAVVMAQTGKKVVLVDADLRKPTQHKRWGVPNNVGLTGALLLEDDDDNVDYLLEKTDVDNLWVIPSGQLPPNPSELLGSHRLVQFSKHLLEDYDLLVFDSPPALAVTDPAVLGQAMDGVLLVVDSSSTREPALVQTVDELQKLGCHIVGVVLNRFRSRGESGYYYYYYDRYYADDDQASKDRDDKGGSSARRKRSASGSGSLSQRFTRRSRKA